MQDVYCKRPTVYRGSCITKALETKFDDFNVGSVFLKLTYPIGHRRFAKNPNPTLKARIWVSNGVLQFPLYTNYLKNRDFDQEAPRIFCLERATIAAQARR